MREFCHVCCFTKFSPLRLTVQSAGGRILSFFIIFSSFQLIVQSAGGRILSFFIIFSSFQLIVQSAGGRILSLYNVVNKLRDLEIKGYLSSKSLKGLDKLIVKLEEIAKTGQENLEVCSDVFPDEVDFIDEEKTYACLTGECLRHSKSPCKLYSCKYEKKRNCDTKGYLNRNVDTGNKPKKIDVCPLFARYDPWNGSNTDNESISCNAKSPKTIELMATWGIKLK